jgi:hypothetical protein
MTDFYWEIISPIMIMLELVRFGKNQPQVPKKR